MIRAESQATPYLTRLTNGKHAVAVDSPQEKGGQGEGLRPHELLEAALAGCISLTVRAYADRREIPLESLDVIVRLDRSDPDEAVFSYELQFKGELTDDQRDKLKQVARACKVSKTLQRKLSFVPSV